MLLSFLVSHFPFGVSLEHFQASDIGDSKITPSQSQACDGFSNFFLAVATDDRRESLAAALRGEETGIATSEVPVGSGVNAENIKNCVEYLKETDWDGGISIETYGTDESIAASCEFLRGLL